MPGKLIEGDYKICRFCRYATVSNDEWKTHRKTKIHIERYKTIKEYPYLKDMYTPDDDTAICLENYHGLYDRNNRECS